MKAHGRRHGQAGAQKRAKIGFDYVHSVVDDHTTLAYSEAQPDEKDATCAGFPAACRRLVCRPWRPRIERVMTDNHDSYTLCRAVAEAITPHSHRRPNPDQPTDKNLSAEYT